MYVKKTSIQKEEEAKMRCSEVKVRLSQDELHSFEFFITGRQDANLTDSDSSDQENYTCPCGKTFKRKAPYQRHMDISHSNVESYRCKVCNKTFGKKCTLTMHMSIHGSDDRKAFDSMERPSTRSQIKSSISSPLVEKKTDSFKNNTCKTDSKRITRSSSKETVKGSKYSTRSTSRESVKALRSTCKGRAASRSKSRSLERTVKASIKPVISEDSNETLVTEHNNNLHDFDLAHDKCSSDKENNNCQDSHDSVSEHGRVETDPVKTVEDIVSAVTTEHTEIVNTKETLEEQHKSNLAEEADTRSVCTVVNSSQASVTPVLKQLSTVKCTEATLRLPIESKPVLSINNNIIVKPAKVQTSTVSPDNNRVSIINTLKKTDSEVKPNTIVIVIREAKKLQTDTSKIIKAVTANKDMIATQQIVPISSGSTTFQTQKVIIDNNNLIPKPITTSQVKPVNRTVVSVAPNILTSSVPMSKMVAIRNSSVLKDEYFQTDSELSHISADGESTESDDGTDDYTPVRKSARLDGKVPGWKKILTKESSMSEMIDEQKSRKRRISSYKAEEECQPEEGELSDITEELFGDVAAEMDIDDQEIKDMSASLFSKKQRVYKDEYACEICGKSFSTEKYLQMHSSLHGASTPARNLVAENYKVNEMKDVDGYRSTWTCKICNKSFAQNSSFKNHMRTHSDERPFVCDVCSIGFKERYHLKKHMLFKHSNELKEKCQFCGKRFKDSTAVRAHERIHSDHRPYPCRRCGKAFKTSECLWHHENRSKTCGAMGGPPLPPLPKKGRVSRKSKNSQDVSVQQTLTLKKEENNMLDLVQQIIHADSSKESQSLNTQSMKSQYSNITVQQADNQMTSVYNPVTSVAYHSPQSSLNYMEHTTQSAFTQSNPVQCITTSIPAQPTIPNQVLIKNPVSSQNQFHNVQINKQQSGNLQTHTVKLNQGQSLVFSVPVLKDGNIDPAAQVTKAILDAISNTTGALKGNINIQKTIQCAVNNVQEAFDPNKKATSYSTVPNTTAFMAPQVNYSMAGQPRVAYSVQKFAENNNKSSPIEYTMGQQKFYMNNIPVTDVQQIYQHQDQTYVVSKEIKQEMPDPEIQVQHSQQYQQPAAKPQLVSILPPISSVAQAMQPQMKSEIDMLDDDYSTDSGDEDEDSIPPANTLVTAENKIFTVAGQTSRPVAAVQPVRRIDFDMKSEQGVKESTSEPYIVNNSRMKSSNYTCPKCQKGFASLSAYEKHLQKHEEVRPFQCETCDIGFKLKVHLKKHNLYRHSTDYPCECSICGKRFKDSSAVRLHERIHSEERPFKCGCSKSFKTKENLWGHQNRKLCPYAGYSEPDQYYTDSNAVQAHAKLDDGTYTAHATVKSLSNKIIAEAVVSNKHVKAQAMIGQNGEVRASVLPHSNDNNVYLASSNGNHLMDHKAIVKTEDGEIHCTVSLPSTSSQLPSFATFTTPVQSQSTMDQHTIQVKKESIADQCPTIQNLLKTGPRSVTKLPGIQQLFKQHMKPPPPYPGQMTPPRSSYPDSTYSSENSLSSPVNGIPSSPVYNRQNSRSPITSNLNVMLNPDQLYSTGTTRDPFLRNPSDYSPTTNSLAKSPRAAHVVSPSPSGDNSVPQVIYWDEESEQKPVVAQWQQTDSETLFHELSSSMINQL